MKSPQIKSQDVLDLHKQKTDAVVRQFQAAMALMSIIPLLAFVYLIGRSTGFHIFSQSQGILVLGIIGVSLGGMLLARVMVQKVVRDLARANEDLHRANELKTAFVRNVAHEATTPLATARGNLDAVYKQLYGPVLPEVKHPILISLRQIDRLLRMVAGLLDISKIERGVFPMKLGRADLTQLLVEAVESALPPERVRVGSDGSPRPIEEADRDRLVQVIVNFLTNAEKYGPPGAEIRAEIRDAEEFYELRVADRGDGVPDAIKEKVFDPFMRSTARDVAGVGLGLAISKHIITLHGGAIWIEDNPGGGSVFAFRVPKRKKGESS